MQQASGGQCTFGKIGGFGQRKDGIMGGEFVQDGLKLDGGSGCGGIPGSRQFEPGFYSGAVYNAHKHTFDQPGRVVWDIAENHFPPPVLQEAIERRRFFVGVDGIADVGHTTSAAIVQSDFISRDVVKEKPVRLTVLTIDRDYPDQGTLSWAEGEVRRR